MAAIEDLGRLSIEDLGKVRVTSAAKRSQPLAEAAAAIYVITRDDIRRAGATTIPEALRLAPNLQVAQLDASTYAISARGFNHSTATANKLLVLIDGRTVYSPLFSGTFWDAQNVMLADIDRIEVISGPGGTLWGANAVNGVINIVTRSSQATQGLLASGDIGTVDSDFNVRFGGRLSDNASYRFYLMGFNHGHTDLANGNNATDAWHNLQGGFRTDWTDDNDTFTLQGDLYNGDTKDQPDEVMQSSIDGGNILSTWRRQFDNGASLRTQAYFDRARRSLVSGIVASVDTYDIDTQYNFAMGARHTVIVGGGYRMTDDKFVAGPGTSYLDPASRRLRLGNIFAQDEIALTRSLRLTLGLKAETNTYTGLEWMPDVRIAWQPWRDALVWGAVSRAVRTPSRFDRELVNPGLIEASPDFQSEDLIAYEIGYRGEVTSRASISVSLYYNVYSQLRTVETSPTGFPLEIENNMSGDVYGAEIWGSYALTDWWRFEASYDNLHKSLHLSPFSHDVFGVDFAGNDPAYQFSLRSSMDLPHRVALDLELRSIDSLPSPPVPSYTELNARVGWRMSDTVELSLIGTNLLRDHHLEFVNSSLPPKEIRRAVMVGLRWEL